MEQLKLFDFDILPPSTNHLKTDSLNVCLHNKNKSQVCGLSEVVWWQLLLPRQDRFVLKGSFSYSSPSSPTTAPPLYSKSKSARFKLHKNSLRLKIEMKDHSHSRKSGSGNFFQSRSRSHRSSLQIYNKVVELFNALRLHMINLHIVSHPGCVRVQIQMHNYTNTQIQT